MFAVVDSKTLVLGADEDGRDDVTGNKDYEHGIVDVVVVDSVENGEEYKSQGTNDGEDNGAD